MGYQAYPEYKESGVEWLGKIPSHWDQCPVKRKFLIANGSTPKSGEAEFWDGDILWITPADFSRASSGYLNASGRTITDAGLASCGTRLVPSNSIVVSVRAPIGEVIQAASELCTNQGCKSLIKDTSEIHERFFFYVFSCSSKQLNALGLGTTFMELSTHGLGQYRVPLPPQKEQERIAQFLDHKTAQIDRLIEKKQELIGKLQEQRIAIITQAVTKGLVPEAPMQNTEISWLGAIPYNWEISPLKRIISEDTRNGLYKDKEQFIADGAPFVQMGEAFAEPELTQTAKDRVNTTQGELQKWGLLEGDLLFARRSLVFEGSGKCVIIGKLQEPHLFESSMIRVRIDTKKALPQFIFHYFQSAFSRAEILATTKTVTISGIDSQQLKGLTVCLPDIKTQGEIVDFIYRSSEKFSAAITANSTTIERLQEYRTALITAAVTGQIDVRDWQAPASVEASEPDKEVA